MKHANSPGITLFAIRETSTASPLPPSLQPVQKPPYSNQTMIPRRGPLPQPIPRHATRLGDPHEYLSGLGNPKYSPPQTKLSQFLKLNRVCLIIIYYSLGSGINLNSLAFINTLNHE